jgi:hypothetical protein
VCDESWLIKDTEINHNISEFFGKLSPWPRHGHNIQLDELAINEGAYYDKSRIYPQRRLMISLLRVMDKMFFAP